MRRDLLRGASDRTASSYDERFGEQQRVKFATALGRHPLPEGLLLDAGCGTGLIGAAAPDRSWIGVDLSRAMLRRAAGRGFGAVQADLDALPLATGAFAAAVAFTSLIDRESWDPALPELARVVRPGGLVLVTVLTHDVPGPPDVAGLALIDRFECGVDVGFAFSRL